jgi:hypothetical protein
MLELLDTEHEECFITNKQTEGYPLSRIRTMLELDIKKLMLCLRGI